jgi:formylglycine-generating enzyme required for sulfatase activity
MRYAKILVLLLLLISTTVSDIQSQSNVKTQKLTYGEDVYANNRNAIVTIVAYDNSGNQKGLGSGFFTSSEGELVTNYHVVEDASALLVKLLTGALFPVSGWLASDQEKDFAVLKVQGKELPTVRLGSLNSVRVGQKVFALGSPFGMEQTFTDGMVSSLRDGSEVNMPNLQKVIQHTAPLSPGNSGGPLFNEQGLVIGINTFQSELGQNINFAIPIDYVKPELGKTDVKPLPVAGGVRIRQKDGMKMVYIPAGTFMMGTSDAQMQEMLRDNPGWSADWFNDEKPVHEVYTDAFYMDEHEVTNAQFKKFLEDNPEWRKDRIDGKYVWNKDYYLSDWNGMNYPSGKADHPVAYVSWYDAAAYAQWAGARLPTEAQWEKSARGGLAGKRYPWGDTITHDDANYSGTGGRDRWDGTSPVGSFPANGYGLFDMAGNVWEWCADEYDLGYDSKSPQNNPTGPGVPILFVSNDFTNVTSFRSRVVRGGSWLSFNLCRLRCAFRHFSEPAVTNSGLGFRCCSR